MISGLHGRGVVSFDSVSTVNRTKFKKDLPWQVVCGRTLSLERSPSPGRFRMQIHLARREGGTRRRL